VLAVLAVLASGCASSTEKKDAAVLGPTESVLEIVAVLRRHVPDDTYRFPPARDFTGRNVYRASLMRLENVERIHAESLRAGHLEGVIAFSKARALERLRAFDIAASYYEVAAERDERLHDEAMVSASVCSDFDGALEIGPEPGDPLAVDADVWNAADAEAVVAAYDERIARLRRAADGAPAHYETIAREEIERADVARARWFESMRYALPNGHVRAVSERQRVVSRHAASHRELEHQLALADLYAALAREYVEAVPPESLDFDPPRLRELVDAASQIYQRVAARDGTPEKLEASRKLEAFLAFTLEVDRDRFASP
jgi:hypothetical protein